MYWVTQTQYRCLESWSLSVTSPEKYLKDYQMTMCIFFISCVFTEIVDFENRMLLNCAWFFCRTIWHFPADGSFVKIADLSKLMKTYLPLKRFTCSNGSYIWLYKFKYKLDNYVCRAEICLNASSSLEVEK